MTLTIAHITDRHAADPSHDVTTQDDYDLADAVLRDEPDLIIDGGDVVGSGEPEQYDEVRGVSRLYRDADPEYLVCPGNHDVEPEGTTWVRWNRDQWESYAAEMMDGYTAGDQWPQVRDYGDVRVVLIDTCADPEALARGKCTAEQIERVESAVEEWSGPVVVAGHHCPSAADRGLKWPLALDDRKALGAALDRAGSADVWLTGHLHRSRVWSSTFGAEYLLALGMSAADGKYRRIEVGVDGVEWEVASV